MLEFYGSLAKFEELRSSASGNFEFLVLMLITSSLAHLPPMKVVSIASGALGVNIWLFIASCIVARGARFALMAWLLQRYGEPIREFIEKRLGLLAAIGGRAADRAVFCGAISAGLTSFLPRAGASTSSAMPRCAVALQLPAVRRARYGRCRVLAASAPARTQSAALGRSAGGASLPLAADPPERRRKPPAPSGLADAAGDVRRDRPLHRSVDHAASGAGVKGAGETLGATTNAAGDLAKGVTDAAGTVARLPAPTSSTGHELCAVAPNGAPDCGGASVALCKSKGFERGSSLDITSAFKCPAQMWREGARAESEECRDESFVSRAICQ